ncbi:GNAT family N-acetyltransferase [Psychrobacillus lasiicapitis]|uniref:GNAT family N-acetyltransferase n=1 Tax=Psychrobacillus lasiicapitis TaxID=1636719 RepID=A0A544TAR5_9BACI|nr:GNAT family N-acetyltransferase [Psychrobacillus lasiicapitis]TQR14562.1 GNAT family N-acetyltransferase [Psychrobacillus lasiicapitis]GGA30334.1 acetyltransferase [Psychrobacillus lasiicapitis]
MAMNQREFQIKELGYIIRPAMKKDAKELSEIRVQIDGETENLDREKGEAYIDTLSFEGLINADTEERNNLFLVAVMNDKIVGFSRCEGNLLKRFAHKVEFGVCVLKDYWGYGIGTNLLKESIGWADSNKITKITLQVIETNVKAVNLYKKFGFKIEGILEQDKILSDGKYYNTIVMGRFNG